MHSAKSDYLFVYSSLLQGFPTTDYEYVSRYFNFTGLAKTKGVLSVLHNIVVGTPTNDDRFIHGELYEIKEQNQFSFAIGQLDEYEGVNPEPPQPPMYKRSIAQVVTENGSQYDAWVYWYLGDISGLPVIQSGNVLDFLKRNRE